MGKVNFFLGGLLIFDYRRILGLTIQYKRLQEILFMRKKKRCVYLLITVAYNGVNHSFLTIFIKRNGWND